MQKRQLDTIPFAAPTSEELEKAILDGSSVFCKAEIVSLQGEEVLSVSCTATQRLYWPDCYYYGNQTDAFTRFQFFAFENGYKTKVFLKEECKWSDKSVADFVNNLHSYSEEDVDTVRKFFDGKPEESIWRLTERHAESVRLERKKARLQKEVEQIRKDMSTFRPLPKNYFQWADGLFTDYVFFDNTEKNGYCSYCKKDFPLAEKPKHDGTAKCPHCHHTYTAKNAKLGRGKLREVVWSMKLSKGMEGAFNVQMCWHEKTWQDYRNPIRNDRERERIVLLPDRARDYEPGNFRGLNLVNWQTYRNRPYWFFDPLSDPTVITLYNRTSDVRKIIKGTRLERSGFDYLVKDGAFKKMAGFPNAFMACIQQMDKHPSAEIAAKAGFTYLAMKAGSGISVLKEGERLKDILGLSNMEQVNFLLPWKKTLSEDDLKALLHFWEIKGRNPHPDECEIIGKLFMKFHDGSSFRGGRCEFLKTYLTCARHSSIGKMGRYLLGQEEARLYEYRDYLSFLDELGIDYHHNNVMLMPNDLKAAHDEAWGKVRAHRNEVQRLKEEEERRLLVGELEEFAQKWNEYDGEKFYAKKGTFFARTPLYSQELVDEGKYLHHCVKGYTSAWKEDKSRIVFIRTLAEPKVPLYTAEYAPDGSLRQIRADHNGTPPKEAREFAVKLCETMRNVQNVILDGQAHA